MDAAIEIIRQLVNDKKYTVAEIAEQAHVGKHNLYKWLNDKVVAKPKKEDYDKLDVWLKEMEIVPRETRKKTAYMDYQKEIDALNSSCHKLESDKEFLQQVINGLMDQLKASSKSLETNQKIGLAKQEGMLHLLVKVFAGDDKQKAESLLDHAGKYAAKFQELDSI